VLDLDFRKKTVFGKVVSREMCNELNDKVN